MKPRLEVGEGAKSDRSTPTPPSAEAALGQAGQELSSRGRAWVAWAMFSVGCVLVPVVFGVANGVSEPAWDWDNSWFGRVLAVPLLLLGLGLCLGAPFLSPTVRGGRLGLSLGALFVFGALVLLSLLVSGFVFGTGVR